MTEAQQINHLQQQLDDTRQSLATAQAMCRSLTAELAAERARNQPAAWRMGARRNDARKGAWISDEQARDMLLPLVQAYLIGSSASEMGGRKRDSVPASR